MACKCFLFAALAIVVSSNNAYTQTLLSQYEFNGDLTNAATPTATSGGVAPDGTFKEGTDSATAPVGTPVFVTGIDGVLGSALLLDGVDDWVDITTDGHPGSQTGTDFFTFGPGLVSGTVMSWVKVSSALNPGSRWLMGSLNGNDFQSFQMGWNGSQLEAVARASDTPSSEFAVRDSTHDTSWADGTWRHIAVTWDGAGNTGNVYIDGSPVGPAVSPGATLTGDNTQTPWEFPMALGARNSLGTLDGFWEGAIDDLRIYAEALTPGQVQTIFDDSPIAVTPDFNNDNNVDGADFLIWQRGVGSGTTFVEGDANNSSTVDGTDLALWEASFGTSTGPLAGVQAAGVQAVPEPTTWVLAIFGAAAMWMSPSRRRQTA